MLQPVDIVILTHNRQKYLYQTLDALLRKTSLKLRITIVDNASTEPGMIDYLRKLLEQNVIYQLFENRINLWHRGWHIGIMATQSDPFLISDPDIIVPRGKPCWLSQLLKCYSTNKDYARLGLLLHTWNHKLNKNGRSDIRKCDVRPKVGINNEITDAWLDTTMQVMDRQAYIKANGFRTKEPGPCLRQISKYGKCGFYNRIAGYHLGWSEWRDYPAYLIQKNQESTWMHYAEIDLINKEPVHA